MHVRRLACLLLGMWLGGILLFSVVKTQNLASVDEVIEFHPGVGDEANIKKLGGPASARVFLMHFAAEQNRTNSRHWELIQIVVSISLLILIVFGTHEGKITMSLTLLAVVFVFIQHFLLKPSIMGLGRSQDYLVPGADLGGIRHQFQFWNITYIVLEFIKAGICLGLTYLMMKSKPSRRRAGDVDDLGRRQRRITHNDQD